MWGKELRMAKINGKPRLSASWLWRLESYPQHESLGTELFPGKLYDGNSPTPMPACSLREALQYDTDMHVAKCWDDVLCGSSLRHQIKIQMRA